MKNTNNALARASESTAPSLVPPHCHGDWRPGNAVLYSGNPNQGCSIIFCWIPSGRHVPEAGYFPCGQTWRTQLDLVIMCVRPCGVIPGKGPPPNLAWAWTEGNNLTNITYVKRDAMSTPHPFVLSCRGRAKRASLEKCDLRLIHPKFCVQERGQYTCTNTSIDAALGRLRRSHIRARTSALYKSTRNRPRSRS